LENLEEVAERVRSGETSAFRHIVASTHPRLVRLAARILGSVQEAEDVVQESYVKAYRAMATGRFDQRAAVNTWLYRIVSNAAIDALRGRTRRPVPSDTMPEGTWDGASSAEARLALSEIDDWLGELPAEQRAVMVLKSIEGLTSGEIAATLGCSEGAVEQRLVRARAALRKKQEDD
jgi:RNA polymerase sigma-70 factor (ECF subfamily)